MPQPERYECLVLGSGNGGMFLAWDMARWIWRVLGGGQRWWSDAGSAVPVPS